MTRQDEGPQDTVQAVPVLFVVDADRQALARTESAPSPLPRPWWRRLEGLVTSRQPHPRTVLRGTGRSGVATRPGSTARRVDGSSASAGGYRLLDTRIDALDVQMGNRGIATLGLPVRAARHEAVRADQRLLGRAAGFRAESGGGQVGLM
jgi:hypothetical protein